MKALILAGGRGTRLRPLTYRIPKPIIPVVNKPLLAHQIELLKRAGLTEIILAVHYQAEQIKKVLGGGEGLGVKLIYSIEEKPMGTAGAVKNARKFFDDEVLVVFNGDVITQIDLREVLNFYHQKKARVVIVLTPVADPSHYGLVITDKENRVEKFLEKPSRDQITTNNINAGIYILDPKVFDCWTESAEFSFERELFPRLLAKGVPFLAYLNQGYWLDLGSPQKFLEAHFDIMRGKVNFSPAGRQISPGVWLGEGIYFEDKNYRPVGPVVLGEGCQLKKGSRLGALTTLGREVMVGAGSIIEKSVVLNRTVIGQNVTVRDSIIGEDVVLEDEVVIEGGLILAHSSVIKKGSKILGALK